MSPKCDRWTAKGGVSRRPGRRRWPAVCATLASQAEPAPRVATPGGGGFGRVPVDADGRMWLTPGVTLVNARSTQDTPRLRRPKRGGTRLIATPAPATDRWVLSYADFLLLLFALFALLYGTAAWELEQLRAAQPKVVPMPPTDFAPWRFVNDDAKPAWRWVRDDAPPPPAAPPVDSVAPPAVPTDPLLDSMRALRQAVHHLIERGEVSLHRSAAGLELEIRTQVLFASASADLQPTATTLLWRLAQVLKPLPHPIRVEGFTDNLPISTAVFPSNWELSAARSASVVHVLADAGVAPQRLAAVGYGEFQPIAPNDNPEGRARNRRVVLVVVAPLGTGDAHIPSAVIPAGFDRPEP